MVVAQIDWRHIEHMHDDLVEQAALVRIDHPQPQERVDDGRTHPRKQPHRAKEGAETPGHRSGDQRQQQRERDVKDPERGQDEDERDAKRAEQPRVARYHSLEILEREIADRQRAAHVGERQDDVDDDRRDEEEKQQHQSRPEKQAEVDSLSSQLGAREVGHGSLRAVAPAKAGAQLCLLAWIPACAGMTKCRVSSG